MRPRRSRFTLLPYRFLAMTAPFKLAAHRVAIVTGAASGLGRSIALRLAQDGHDVVVTDLPGTRVQEVAQEIEGLGRRSMVLYTDLTKEEEVQKMMDNVAERLGSVDIARFLLICTSYMAYNDVDGRECRDSQVRHST